MFYGRIDMNYMTIKEAAEKWGLSERRVQEICELKKIPGITKFGRAWAIPENAVKPADQRIKSGKYIKN
jgi:excisionase family DNA binding protein